ncbi:hypothetical protein HMPREF0591_1201 [Mycobacterium parascrofulaceum ATCC BAA-614]|uniref:Uncharacterized protein n=1 Tax=Mycobacterium parascrofulaceum ATCC BAA-614 TaxID=525368 RepID=D5P4V7_9MYCO|nr:hypothetical protein [Mycobacterium parascrofulaceum]EFG78861.1 hypothetical protein HMPREF0591_1201 [Mycobacterium parascrofulaceum ATCC BAA-614]
MPACRAPTSGSARARRNTRGCKLVTLGNYGKYVKYDIDYHIDYHIDYDIDCDIADKAREPARKGHRIAERVGSDRASRRRLTT